MCLNNEIPILFVGPTGTGKSAIVLDYMVNLPKEKFLANIINFSAKTTSTMVTLFACLLLTLLFMRKFLDARSGYV